MEPLQILADFFLSVGPECNASDDILWLLQPQHVADFLLHNLSQQLYGHLLWGLEERLVHALQFPRGQQLCVVVAGAV